MFSIRGPTSASTTIILIDTDDHDSPKWRLMFLTGCGIRLSPSSDLLLMPVWDTTGAGTVREIITVIVRRHNILHMPIE